MASSPYWGLQPASLDVISIVLISSQKIPKTLPLANTQRAHTPKDLPAESSSYTRHVTRPSSAMESGASIQQLRDLLHVRSMGTSEQPILGMPLGEGAYGCVYVGKFPHQHHPLALPYLLIDLALQNYSW